MNRFRERYVVDEDGNRQSVIIEIALYQKILEELEELDAIRAYDEAKAAKDEVVPFGQAVREIEKGRQ